MNTNEQRIEELESQVRDLMKLKETLELIRLEVKVIIKLLEMKAK